MTTPTMALAELAEKGSDIDMLRQMVQFMAQRLMDIDVEGRCGAGYDEKSPERTNSRNGYRERAWDTRAGSVALKIPKLRCGSYFPEFLETQAHCGESAYRCHPGGLYPGYFHPLGGRLGQVAGHEWRLQNPGQSSVR